GDYVKINDRNFYGYVVAMKKSGAIICFIKSDGSTDYDSAYYKNITKLNNKDLTVNVQDMISKAKPGKKITYNGKTYKITRSNRTTFSAKQDDGSSWKIPKSRILDFTFL